MLACLQAFRYLQEELERLTTRVKMRFSEILEKSRCKVHYFSERKNVAYRSEGCARSASHRSLLIIPLVALQNVLEHLFIHGIDALLIPATRNSVQLTLVS